jgi:hypothetical protein
MLPLFINKSWKIEPNWPEKESRGLLLESSFLSIPQTTALYDRISSSLIKKALRPDLSKRKVNALF